MPVLLLV
ncbi:UNVERIFIED_CONTAM: hypothetical protein GTU68_023021 [Idotea baltica]|nr:hypothetical protein [Idotea baltica]